MSHRKAGASSSRQAIGGLLGSPISLDATGFRKPVVIQQRQTSEQLETSDAHVPPRDAIGQGEGMAAWILPLLLECLFSPWVGKTKPLESAACGWGLYRVG